jgi:hypothetical protein
VIRADYRPTNIEQYWVWCGKFMPRDSSLHMVDLAAIRWAIWQVRNNIFLKEKD